MRNLHITKGTGGNENPVPKAGPKASGPHQTNDGKDLGPNAKNIITKGHLRKPLSPNSQSHSRNQ